MKIVHVFRAPVGGLFRHVCDLARGQAALGHEVGIICDSGTGGDFAARRLEELGKYCSLGVVQKPISRMPGLGDISGTLTVIALVRAWRPDVLHGHGAKGGVYARLAAPLLGRRSFYTPHGGSLHYETSRPAKFVMTSVEKGLRRLGTGICFVCNYERDRFNQMIGIAGKPHRVVYNGLWQEEFLKRDKAANATDFLFVGEMRDYKGVDILLHALAEIPGATATLVGDGPSMDDYKVLAGRLGLSDRVVFPGRMQMEHAVVLGRIMVLPSRFESFPYIVLETAAAQMPLITSAVGGIPEVVPKAHLCEPLTAAELATRMKLLLQSVGQQQLNAEGLAAHIRETCSADEMVKEITGFYESA